MLRKAEVRQLAFEMARDHSQASMNEAYHAHIHAWGRSRGGVEIGAFDSWKEGWAAGRAAAHGITVHK